MTPAEIAVVKAWAMTEEATSAKEGVKDAERALAKVSAAALAEVEIAATAASQSQAVKVVAVSK